MATEADRLKREIDATRQELARDVGRLADHAARPIARRRMARVRDGLTSLKDKVIGVSEEAVSTVSDAAGDVGSTVGATVSKAPQKLADATKGSPVAVGLIAFGSGLLAAALVPESDAERRVARQVSENLGPITEPLQQAGRAFAADVRTSVETAAGEVRTAAVDAASSVGAVAAAGASEVRMTAVDAAAHTVHDAADRGRSIIDQSRRSLES